MNRFQEAVAEFHAATGGFGNVSTPEGRLLRAKLIMEEAVETVAALGFNASGYITSPESAGSPSIPDPDAGPNRWKPNPNYHEVDFERNYEEFNLLDFIDGLCDLTYVTMGGAVNIPVNIERHFEEVHRANMDKVRGRSFREDGKVLKPEGWVPPDHQRVLDLYNSALYPNQDFIDTYHG